MLLVYLIKQGVPNKVASECIYIYIYIRGGTVHRCHGSVRTSVRGHGSMRFRYNRRKK